MANLLIPIGIISILFAGILGGSPSSDLGTINNPIQITEKDFYSNRYQTIENNDVIFELPKRAEHTWRNDKPLDDYSVIVNMSVEGKEYLLKISWEDERYRDDTIKIDYNFIDGILDENRITPYSINKISDVRFNNLKVQAGEITGYKTRRQVKRINKTGEITEIYYNVSYPIYEWSDFKPIIINNKGSFTAVDDVEITSCGGLDAGYYYMTSDLTTDCWCLGLFYSPDYTELDMRGHKISTTGTDYKGDDGCRGIDFVDNPSNSVFKNGIIEGFDVAVWGEEGGQVENMTLYNFHTYGFYLENNGGYVLDGINITIPDGDFDTDIGTTISFQYGDNIRINDYNITYNEATTTDAGMMKFSGVDNIVMTNVIMTGNFYDTILLINDNNVYIENLSIFDTAGGESGINVVTSGTNYTIKSYYNDESYFCLKMQNTAVSSLPNFIQDIYCGYNVYFYNFNDTTCLNCSYTTDEIYGTTNYYREWYYQAYVNDTNGNDVENAEVDAYYLNGSQELDLTTGADGFTDIVPIIEYFRNSTGKYLMTPHTIYADDGLGHSTSHIYNVSEKLNNLDYFTLTLQCWVYSGGILRFPKATCGVENYAEAIRSVL